MNKITALFLTALFLTGCSIKDIGAPIVKYSISDTTRIHKQNKINKILKIAQFEAPLKLLGNKIWYDRNLFETGSYLYSSWSENFSTMIEQDIVSRVYKSGLFESVFSPYSKARADLLLEGEIVKAVQHVKENGAYVSFEIRLYLINAKSSKFISSKDFSYFKKCDSIDALGAVRAYNDIIKIFNKEVILWLKTSVNEN